MGRLRLLLAGAVLATLVGAASADAARQTLDARFATTQSATPTSLSLRIDYLPPQPGSKPPAVERVVLVLPAGTAIDPGAVARCDASDAALYLLADAACPGASRVGGGAVSLDTGVPGPRGVDGDLSLYNAGEELILLVRARTVRLEAPPLLRGALAPASRPAVAVTRAVVDGRTITTEVPPVPGGPDDLFTALDRVSFTAGRGGYLTTPPACPAAGAWATVGAFTYRGGASETVRATSPC